MSHTTEIAQPAEPVLWWRTGATTVLHNITYKAPYKSKSWTPLYTAPQKPTAPEPVNADLLEACKAIVAWDDSENDATVYAEDGGAHWRFRQKLCADAFDKARAAIARATGGAA